MPRNETLRALECCHKCMVLRFIADRYTRQTYVVPSLGIRPRKLSYTDNVDPYIETCVNVDNAGLPLEKLCYRR